MLRAVGRRAHGAGRRGAHRAGRGAGGAVGRRRRSAAPSGCSRASGASTPATRALSQATLRALERPGRAQRRRRSAARPRPRRRSRRRARPARPEAMQGLLAHDRRAARRRAAPAARPRSVGQPRAGAAPLPARRRALARSPRRAPATLEEISALPGPAPDRLAAFDLALARLAPLLKTLDVPAEARGVHASIARRPRPRRDRQPRTRARAIETQSLPVAWEALGGGRRGPPDGRSRRRVISPRSWRRPPRRDQRVAAAGRRITPRRTRLVRVPDLARLPAGHRARLGRRVAVPGAAHRRGRAERRRGRRPAPHARGSVPGRALAVPAEADRAALGAHDWPVRARRGRRPLPSRCRTSSPAPASTACSASRSARCRASIRLRGSARRRGRARGRRRRPGAAVHAAPGARRRDARALRRAAPQPPHRRRLRAPGRHRARERRRRSIAAPPACSRKRGSSPPPSAPTRSRSPPPAWSTSTACGRGCSRSRRAAPLTSVDRRGARSRRRQRRPVAGRLRSADAPGRARVADGRRHRGPARTGYLTRLMDTLPDVEVVAFAGDPPPAPMLATAAADQIVLVSRDREDEVEAFARRVRAATPPAPADGAIALVHQRPLPYLYLARQVLGAYDVSWQAVDALPLAAEPWAAAVDVVLTFAASDASRAAGVALLSTPLLQFDADGSRRRTDDAGAVSRPLTADAVAAADRELADALFVGGRERLIDLAARWREEIDRGTGRSRRHRALVAVAALLRAAEALAPLAEPRPASAQLETLAAVLVAAERPPIAGAARERHLRARGAIRGLLQRAREAYLRFGDPPIAIDELAPLLRRLMEAQTFSPRVGPGLVHVVDASAAAFGRYADVTLAGLIEGEWPTASGRNVFLPSNLLKDLGWPNDADRRAAARAMFDDLLHLPRRSLALSAFTLEDDAIVPPVRLSRGSRRRHARDRPRRGGRGRRRRAASRAGRRAARDRLRRRRRRPGRWRARGRAGGPRRRRAASRRRLRGDRARSLSLLPVQVLRPRRARPGGRRRRGDGVVGAGPRHARPRGVPGVLRRVDGGRARAPSTPRRCRRRGRCSRRWSIASCRPSRHRSGRSSGRCCSVPRSPPAWASGPSASRRRNRRRWSRASWR